MALEVINTGTAANSGDGDNLRAFATKSKNNFAEIYADDFVTSARIANDVVDHDQLANRYTASSSVTSATAITIDTSSADVFTWTAGHSTTVAFTNVKVGSTCVLAITGGGSSYTLALGNINGSAGTFNKLGGTYDDTSSTKNFIEFKFISTSEAWYQISQIAS